MKRKLEILHPISSHLGSVYDGFLETLITKEPKLMSPEKVVLPNHIVWTKRIDDLTRVFGNLEKDNPELKELPFSKFEVRVLKTVASIDSEDQIQFCEKYGQTKVISSSYGTEAPTLVAVAPDQVVIIFSVQKRNYQQLSLFSYHTQTQEFILFESVKTRNFLALSDCSYTGILYLISEQQGGQLQLVEYEWSQGLIQNGPPIRFESSNDLQKTLFDKGRQYRMTNYDQVTKIMLVQGKRSNDDAILLVCEMELGVVLQVSLPGAAVGIGEIEVKTLQPLSSLLLVAKIGPQIWQIHSTPYFSANQYQNSVFKCVLDLKQHKLDLRNIVFVNEKKISQAFATQLVEFLPPFQQLIKTWNYNDQESIKFLLLENLLHLNPFAEMLALALTYSLKHNPILGLEVLRYIDFTLHLCDLEDLFPEILLYLWNLLPGILLPNIQTLHLTHNPDLANILSWAEEKTRQNLHLLPDQLIIWILICKQIDKMHLLKLK